MDEQNNMVNDENNQSQYRQEMPQNQQWQQNQQAPQYGQPQYSPQTSQYGQPQYSQSAPQYSQPTLQYGQPQYSQQAPQYGQPQYSQQAPQYGQSVQQYGQPQYSQQAPQYDQPWQQNQPTSQYGQAGQSYDRPMGYMGYEYRQDNGNSMKKGSAHIPNIMNIAGIILALISVFLPYAHIGSDVRSISGVFGISVVTMIIAAVVIIADMICAFIDKTVCYILNLIISVFVGGALIFEFVLAVIDWKKLDSWEEIGLSFGSWVSVVAALLLLVSVPVWWIISRKKRKSATMELKGSKQ